MRKIMTIQSLKSLVIKCILGCVNSYHKLQNKITLKKRRSIFFYPHINCKYDNYDVFNYKSDNVLCLFMDIVSDDSFRGWDLYIVYYNKSKEEEYKLFAEQHKNKRITFIFEEDAKGIRKAFYCTDLIFTDEMYRNYPYKLSRQKVVCLNYYPFPFKSDYVKLIDKNGKSSYMAEQKRINASYDALVSISDLSSIMITQAEPFFYEKCVTLGFPRSDVFYHDCSSLKEKVISNIEYSVKNVIIYVPTHRDYENEERDVYDESLSKERTIWGYESQSALDELENVLERTQSIIIAKIHPIQARSVLKKSSSKRVILYNDITETYNISLNELMAISDVMITDYTSAVFDYLNVNNPIIYYFYDIERYIGTRGFIINPMAPLIAGEVTKNLHELSHAIEDQSNGVDLYKDKREFLSDLIIRYKDANAASRIKDYFIKLR